MVKGMIGAILALFVGASAPVLPTPNYNIPRAAVVYVSCEKYMGTAVKVGADKYLTAAHVVLNDDGKVSKCTVDGKEITDVHLGTNDSATFIGPSSSVVAGYSCKGTENFGHYVAMGYAEGRPVINYEPMIASDISVMGMTAFIGNIYHGMSGGPIVGQDGIIYAIVNKSHPNSGVEVKDTELCQTSTKR